MSHITKPNRTEQRFSRALRILALPSALTLLFWLALAPAAFAGLPTHPRKEALDIGGLNHACGVAVDSKGDVYAASAGESKIKVYDPAHALLTTIADSHEPCGLAVNSKGEVFVVEKAVGKVVRFKPNAYPFAGTPTYGASEPIDSSGTAGGLSIDASDDRLYVSDGDHLNAYNPDGSLGIDEVQTLSFAENITGGTFRLAMPGDGSAARNEVQEISRSSGVSGGTFTLSFKGQTSAPIPFAATAATVQEALEALSTVGVGNVSVGVYPVNPRDWWVEFKAALGKSDVPLIVSDGSNLTGSGVWTNEVAVLAVSDISSPFPYNASHAEVLAALEELQAIGAGDVSVENGAPATVHRITFMGALANADVTTLAVDTSALTGSAFSPGGASELVKGFDGRAGDGDLSAATGLAAYTSPSGDRYVFVADAAPDQVKVLRGSNIRSLELGETIKGPKAGEDFGFGSAGAYLAIDPGNANSEGKCVAVAEQACTAGHLLVYDAAHEAVDEFEADGRFLDRLTGPPVGNAEPTAMAIDRSGGSGDGTIHVTTGAGPGAKALAFGPLAQPSRPLLPELSHVLAGARAVATDDRGDVYVAAGSLIHVFDPSGKEIKVGPAGKGIEDPHLAVQLAVDSSGKLYVRDVNKSFDKENEVTYYTPSAYPPVDGTTYARHEPALEPAGEKPGAIAVNPGPGVGEDHLFVMHGKFAREYDSAGHGSTLLVPEFAKGLNLSAQSLAVEGASGNVYFAANHDPIAVVNAAGTELLARINGKGAPKGLLGPNPVLTVDQSNGHPIEVDSGDGTAREYDASGAFVAQFGSFTSLAEFPRIAIDSSCDLHDPPLTEATSPTCHEFDPAYGTVYVAFDDTAPKSFDVTAFGPLAYGEPPLAVTGGASDFGPGVATLNGSVNPNGFDVTECRFEYLTDDQYLTNGKTFAGAKPAPCVPAPAGIGKGSVPVAVHAELSGLAAEGRYRFRLVAANKYGESAGDPGLFGPPLLTTKSPQPVLYDEATLRAKVDPSGLGTGYRFEYGPTEAYGQSTPAGMLPPSDGGASDIAAALTGLGEGATYHFRVVAENAAGEVEGPDQTLTTLQRRPPEACANSEYRLGLSASLPDCRAYEIVTPAETGGLAPYAAGTGVALGAGGFNNWLVPPRGGGAGNRLTYFTDGTLPGFEGNGRLDGYRAERGAGAHPTGGWENRLISPSFAEAGGGGPYQQGVAADQLYSFWQAFPRQSFPETLDEGVYLRTPASFEVLGRGSLGVDPQANSRFLSSGAAHVIFDSKAHLEEASAPAGTRAVYDRAAGAPQAAVISVRPDGSPFAEGENATYVAASEDGAAVLFRVEGTLYLHRDGQSFAITEGPNTFAGISADGSDVFYADGNAGDAPAGLFACETESGACAGPGAQTPTPVGPPGSQGIFVNVSPDGSAVLFSSEEALTDAEKNEAGEVASAGEPNLYIWDRASEATHFVAILSAGDFGGEAFGGHVNMSLSAWTSSINPGAGLGRAGSPTRSTPGGGVFAFQSHARLTAYDNEGKGEIYRYAPGAPEGERLSCPSCDPSGAAPSGNALLQAISAASATNAETMIANITDDGGALFFQSPDRLLPDDANDAVDVYEWKAAGVSGCKRASGCLALISSGQGEEDSLLYGMSADGHDVFFRTPEKLVGADVPGSRSIYDARVGGGIPDPPLPAPCQGDACQGAGSSPPVLPAPASTGAGDGNVQKGAPRPRCPKGKRQVVAKGRVHCAKHRVKRHKPSNHKRRAGK